jgi:hypothetical protein
VTVAFARFWGVIALAVSLWLGAMGVARADAGRPTGWATERASEEIVVGRLVLRYEPELADQAEALAETAPQLWSEVERPLAGDVDDRVVVYVLDHAGGVADATGMPRWAAGVADPDAGEIMIAMHGPDGAPTDLENLLSHEMAHVILYRATGGAELPRWFHEGVAESFASGISFGRAQTLAGAVFGRGVPDLDRLEKMFRGDPEDVAVAYAASRDFVSFLRGRDPHGAELRQVMAELRAGHGFEIAFVRATGRGLGELSMQWRSDLPDRFVWYPLIATGGLPFFVLAPLVAVAWMRRRRAHRRGLERLEREEHEEVLVFAPAVRAW